MNTLSAPCEASSVVSLIWSFPPITEVLKSSFWVVLSASVLAVSDELSAPEKLLKALDRLINLPNPKMDWGF